jgi:hypothetical protein
LGTDKQLYRLKIVWKRVGDYLLKERRCRFTCPDASSRQPPFGVAAKDPVTFTYVCVLMQGIAVIASCVPAWRAANLDPVRSLRAE